jgi:uncharacterized protein
LVDGRELRRVVNGVVEAWRDRREELEVGDPATTEGHGGGTVEAPDHGIVRREAADDVLTGAQEQFDPRNGGFGDAPKFVHAEAVELLFAESERQRNPDWAAMAERTLDGMLAGRSRIPSTAASFTTHSTPTGPDRRSRSFSL